MSRFFFYFTLVLAAVLALLVTAMNAGRVEVELAFIRLESPLGFALVVAFVVGLVGGLFWRLWWVAQLLNERGRLRRALREAESKAARAVAASGEHAR
ncbi:MAG TPA: LapA family protein [Steroidobacter sp.]